MTSIPPAAAPGGGDVRTRLQPALRAAMKARDTVAVSALRSVLAAIANAEAVPPPAAAAPAGSSPSGPAPSGDQYVAGSTAGLAATEAERRDITSEEAARIVLAEVAERRAAARQYQAAGLAEQAERLLREAQVIEDLC